MKYETQMPTGCPPPDAAEKDGITGYRFVHDPPSGPSWIPVALSRPQLAGCCKAWGLSLFRSEDQARARFRELETNTRKIRKRIGDHLAQVTLSPDDGVATPPTADGHFTLHEYVGADLSKDAKLVGEL